MTILSKTPNFLKFFKEVITTTGVKDIKQKGISDTFILFNKYIPKSALWMRLDSRAPVHLFKNGGFTGRANFPTNNLNSYVGFNTAFGGWGGVASFAHAYQFANQQGSDHFLYVTLNSNNKLSVPAHVRELDYESGGQAHKKITEMEVIVVGDVSSDKLIVATDELHKLESGADVSNALYELDNSLPKMFNKDDIVSNETIIFKLIRDNCDRKLFDLIDNGDIELKGNYAEYAKSVGNDALHQELMQRLGNETRYLSPKGP